MTSVAVHQYTYQHAGPWTQHAGPSFGLFGTLTLPVDCLGDFGPRGLSVQYTKDVCGCPPAHTGRLWLSVCVLLCPSAHTRLLWMSIGTHISTLVHGLSTLAVPVDCLGDFGPRGLSIQYTQDVRGCPPAHTGRPSLSVCIRLCPTVSVSTHRTSVADVCGCPCVSVCVRQHTQAVRGCPSVHISARWTSVAVHQYTYSTMFVAVRSCPSVHAGRPWLSVCVRQTHRMSVAVHQYTYQHADPWTQHAGPSHGLMLTLPVDCSGVFGPRGLSVQYTQDVRG
ncbi:unnamed protein product [Brassica rapa]|uniref:Uncharacterized protein n=1 Tax=Brassica campestris TaxID=3711 RepID=A0A8D9CUU3_BRACM|nr:unnamed protein product [Brassica rapa]